MIDPTILSKLTVFLTRLGSGLPHHTLAKPDLLGIPGYPQPDR